MWIVGWFIVILVLWYAWETFFASSPGPRSFPKKTFTDSSARRGKTLPPVK